MIMLKTDDDLTHMRASGRLAAGIRDELARRISPGVTTGELDAYAEEMIRQRGARSSFFGYRGFPGHICVSVNEEVVHGIPGKRRIQLGDIVSLDVGINFEGFVGDTATTVMVGVSDAEVIRLVRTTESALQQAIAKAVAGGRLSDISHAVESAAHRAGFTVVKEFVGHGIGRNMHEDPQIPNFGPPGRGPKLKKGMTLAVEPMINMGVAEVDVMEDGWTVKTRDRRPSAHFEHTIAVADGQAEILTWTEEKKK
jgi:methionyl aminopeptidase